MTKEGMAPNSGVKHRFWDAIFGDDFLPLKVKQQPDERGYHVLTLPYTLHARWSAGKITAGRL